MNIDKLKTELTQKLNKKSDYNMTVTGFINKFKPFNADLIAPKSAKKLGLTTQQVLDMWELKGEKGRTRGKILHNFLESLFTDKGTEDLTESLGYKNLIKDDKDYEQSVIQVKDIAVKFHTKIKDTFIPILVEQKMYDEQLGLLGKPDYLFLDKTSNKLILFDAKQGKEINDKGYNKMLGLFLEHKESTLVKASLQLSLYKFIFERLTSYKIDDMIIGHFGDVYNSYRAIDMTRLIKTYYN